MKAVIWLGPREMELKDVAEPIPGADEVLLRVGAVGICGSELSGYLGHNSLRVPPLVMGHEFSGVVAACGDLVTHLAAGEQVIVNPLISCGACELCRSGLENLCRQRKLVGAHRPGAFAELVAVPASCCHRLPEGLSPVDASLAEPLACGVRAARVGGVEAGTRVAIFGCGTIGLVSISACRHVGAEVRLAVDVNSGRLDTAARWGARLTCDARTDDPVVLARRATDGLGVDVVIDAVGSTTTRRAALKAVRPGGTVVLLGLHEAESAVQANDMVRDEVRLAGSFAYTQADFLAAVAMLSAGEVRAASDWLEERPLAACAASFAQLIDAPPAVAKIVLRP